MKSALHVLLNSTHQWPAEIDSISFWSNLVLSCMYPVVSTLTNPNTWEPRAIEVSEKSLLKYTVCMDQYKKMNIIMNITMNIIMNITMNIIMNIIMNHYKRCSDLHVRVCVRISDYC